MGYETINKGHKPLIQNINDSWLQFMHIKTSKARIIFFPQFILSVSTTKQYITTHTTADTNKNNKDNKQIEETKCANIYSTKNIDLP